MRSRLALFLWVVLLGAGCHTYIPVRVTLIDARTERLIAGVAVNPTYAYFLDPFHPDVQPRFTDVHGSLVVPLDVDLKNRSTTGRTPYLGLWLGGDYEPDDPTLQPYIMVPTEGRVREALQAAGGDPRRVSPIPCQ